MGFFADVFADLVYALVVSWFSGGSFEDIYGIRAYQDDALKHSSCMQS